MNDLTHSHHWDIGTTQVILEVVHRYKSTRKAWIFKANFLKKCSINFLIFFFAWKVCIWSFSGCVSSSWAQNMGKRTLFGTFFTAVGSNNDKGLLSQRKQKGKNYRDVPVLLESVSHRLAVDRRDTLNRNGGLECQLFTLAWLWSVLSLSQAQSILRSWKLLVIIQQSFCRPPLMEVISWLALRLRLCNLRGDSVR